MLEISEENFILVASDVHRDDEAFSHLAATAAAQKCLAFIYAGDLDVENCLISQEIINRSFIFLPVCGNCDSRWDWIDLNTDLPQYRTCTFKGLRIFVSHGHQYSEPSAAGLDDRQFDVVVTGHSHVPSLTAQFIDGKRIVFMNPGSAARPRGRCAKSYGLIVFRQNGSVSLEVRTLEGDDLLSQETIPVHDVPVGNN